MWVVCPLVDDERDFVTVPEVIALLRKIAKNELARTAHPHMRLDTHARGRCTYRRTKLEHKICVVDTSDLDCRCVQRF